MILVLSRKALFVKVGAFFILTLATLMLGACQSLPVKIRHTQNTGEIKPQIITPVKPSIPGPFTVSFVGDVILHERLRKREDMTHEGYDKIWRSLQTYIDAADISYANLEGPVAPEYGGVTGFPMFNYPEQIISDLKNNGFDIVSTANNHVLDREAKGIRKTIENLKKNDLAFTGTVTSSELAAQGIDKWYGLTPLPGTSSYIAWVSCTEMTNGNPDKEELVLYCYKDREVIKAIVQQLKEMPDIAGIIMTPHWGEEEKFEIELGRKIWAHQMIDLGAMAVAGSHPHVVQKIEDYQSKDGRKTFIAYSLGNFVSNQPWTPNKASMMLLAKFKMNVLRKLEISDLKYIPLWMNRTVESDGTSKFRLEPVWNFAKKPADAVKIWREQTGEKYLLRSSEQADLFFKK
ncbi:MAG: CapA family protein [Bdellovibrio sp.]|nr:CapA family protein [Bdellovibrio sp.]